MTNRWLDFFVKPSSREFFQTGRDTPGYTLFDWLHGYVYARWTYLYLGIGIGEHPIARAYTRVLKLAALIKPAGREKALIEAKGGKAKGAGVAAGYHGKVLPLESAARLVMVSEDVSLPDLEQVIPYDKARDLILKNPQHILALECPCRSARANPCMPLDVCLIVGDPFASLVEEHHPKKARRITSAEAVDILQAEDARGHVHHAFFKDAMLGRFYAICNCCSCCCGAMQAYRHGTPMLASSGYISVVAEDYCIGCGECVSVCQFGALTLGAVTAEVDELACMGCGICVSHCVQGALVLERAPSKGEPLEICELMAAFVPVERTASNLQGVTCDV